MKLKTKKELEWELHCEILECKSEKKRRAVSEKYKTLIFYIENDPKPAFVENEISRLKRAVKINDEQFYEWSRSSPKETANKTHVQTKTFYNAKFGTKKYKQQIKNLQILIN
ncbi:MAG TPA: hypothetical protein VJ856_01670 [Paludibacteraceae bacterium]|nr:hypothetical protein [Paludibacteraceae bacterium]